MEDSKVAVLIEDLMSQFRTFGEGLQGIRDDVSAMKGDIENIKEDLSALKTENRMEHKVLQQALQELAADQKDIKKKVTELDQEFEIKLRRVK